MLHDDYSKCVELLVEKEEKLAALSDDPITCPENLGWRGLNEKVLTSCWSNAHEAARGWALMTLQMLYWPFFETELDRNLAELPEWKFQPITDLDEQRAFAEHLLADHWRVLVIPPDELSALQERIRRERAKLSLSELGAGNRRPPKTDAAKPKCVWLGECRYQIGDEPPKAIPRQYADVLESLVVLRAATTQILEKHANRSGVSKLLGKLRKNYKELAPYIILPGRKGTGGYQTTIRDGRK